MSSLALNGGVALVTGAGRGIGLATARELCSRGARAVVLVDLPGDELDAAAAGLGDRALTVGADVTDAEAMEGAVQAALEQFGVGRLPARMRRPHPAEAAARAIVDGIEPRKPRGLGPARGGVNLLLRGMLQLMDDRYARQLDVAGAVGIAEAESRRELRSVAR